MSELGDRPIAAMKTAARTHIRQQQLADSPSACVTQQRRMKELVAIASGYGAPNPRSRM